MAEPLKMHTIARIVDSDSYGYKTKDLSVMGNPTEEWNKSKWYERSEVKSALEYLKNQFIETEPEGSFDEEKGHNGTYTAQKIKKIIDEAFPDVFGD